MNFFKKLLASITREIIASWVAVMLFAGWVASMLFVSLTTVNVYTKLGDIDEKIYRIDNTRVFVVSEEIEKLVFSPVIHPEKVFFLVYKDNANLTKDDEGNLAGIDVEDHHREWLERFNSAVQACGTKSKVKLRILGHASSAEFMIDGEIDENSNKNNLDAANMRADRVSSFISNNRNVSVKTEKWGTYNEMAAIRPFSDNLLDENVSDQQLLNRSVSIVLENQGACAIDITNQASGTP